MKKRILVLSSVVALMVVMLAMSVAPGVAKKTAWLCTSPTPPGDRVVVKKADDVAALEAEGYRCIELQRDKPPKPKPL